MKTRIHRIRILSAFGISIPGKLLSILQLAWIHRLTATLLFLAVFLFTQAQTTIVEWTFPNNPDDATADGGIPANLAQVISTHGGVSPPTFDEEGNTTNSASANLWANGAYTKYWQIQFTTLGYGNLTVESKQNSFDPSNFGPKYFDIQYRIGMAGPWTTFTTFVIPTGNHWFQFPPTTLPAICDNKTTICIRWLMTSNEPTQGSGLVLDEAFNRIDDIFVKSYCPLPEPAGVITGTPSVCVGQTGIPYSIPPIPNASGYTWSYSGTGATIIGSTNAITINFSAVATSGILTVFGTNSCGNGPVSPDYYITVNPIPLVTANPISQTTCPGAPITPIVLSNTNNVPGTVFSWTRDNTGILTGIPSSGTGNPISGILNSSNPQSPETTTFSITASANGCSSNTTASVTVLDNTPPLFISFPDPVHWCVQDIVEAVWDGNGDITPERPDWYTLLAGSTTFDLDPVTFFDNCTAPNDLILQWQIDLAGGGSISGNGQISTYPSNIQFPVGDNTITYWLEDTSGNLTPAGNRAVVTVTVHARPDITRDF